MIDPTTARKRAFEEACGLVADLEDLLEERLAKGHRTFPILRLPIFLNASLTVRMHALDILVEHCRAEGWTVVQSGDFLVFSEDK